MSKQWTETTAVSFLRKAKGINVKGNKVLVKNGLNGLNICSAADYLKNNHGYRILL